MQRQPRKKVWIKFDLDLMPLATQNPIDDVVRHLRRIAEELDSRPRSDSPEQEAMTIAGAIGGFPSLRFRDVLGLGTARVGQTGVGWEYLDATRPPPEWVIQFLPANQNAHGEAPRSRFYGPFQNEAEAVAFAPPFPTTGYGVFKLEEPPMEGCVTYIVRIPEGKYPPGDVALRWQGKRVRIISPRKRRTARGEEPVAVSEVPSGQITIFPRNWLEEVPDAD